MDADATKAPQGCTGPPGSIPVAGPNGCQYQDCARCMPQFMPASLCLEPTSAQGRFIADSDAQVSARSYVDRANRDQQHLRNKLRLFGDALASTWQALSPSQRAHTVQQSQPQLYQHKDPEARLLLGLEKPGKTTGMEALEAMIAGRAIDDFKPAQLTTSQRNALLLPYLNVDSLASDPFRLLSLLHHRSASKLEDWVSFDADQLRPGFQHGFLADQFNRKCIIMHGSEYGRLVDWQKEACHNFLMVGYPLATLVLEAQCVLLKILRKLLDHIMPSGKPKEGNSAWQQFTHTGFRAAENIEAWSVYTHQPFSTAPKFEPLKWGQHARAQLEAAQDHLNFLQTDSVYLRSNIDTANDKFFTTQASDMVWNARIVDFVLFDPMHDIRIFKGIQEQCEYLASLHELGDSPMSIGPSSPPSRRYHLALSMLDFTLRCEIHHCLPKINRLIHTSPGFRQAYNYKLHDDGIIYATLKHKIDRHTFMGKAPLYRQDPLHWALLTLTDSPQDLFGMNKAVAMRLIDDRLEDPKERRRISRSLFDLLSRISTCDLIMSEIRHVRPRAPDFDPERMSNANEETFLSFRFNAQGVRDPYLEELNEIKPLLQEYYKRPWPKGKKDEEWLEQATEVRQRLKDLWNKAREITRSMCIEDDQLGPMSTTEVEAEIALMSADLLPAYEEEQQVERLKVANFIEARDAARSAGDAAMKVSKELTQQTIWGKDDYKKADATRTRMKAKTRPEKTLPDATMAEDRLVTLTDSLTLDDERAPAHHIQVNRASIRVFSKMFSSSEDAGGLVKWQQVVTAMTDAGFAATHCGGSPVSFVPVEDTPMTGAIVFHKPHPEPNVDAVMLHCMGKRLKKWFGWEMETFVERKKTKDWSTGVGKCSGPGKEKSVPANCPEGV